MKTFDEVKQELAALGTKAALDLLQAAEQCPESTYSQVSKALCGKENATPEEVLKAVDQLKSRLAQVARERDAAVADLKSVDEKYEALKSMIDDVTFNHEPYGLYLDFREAADAMVEHEHADVWRGPCPENTKDHT